MKMQATAVAGLGEILDSDNAKDRWRNHSCELERNKQQLTE